MAKMHTKNPHPMQAVVWDGDVARFRKNAIVCALLDWASPRGMDLNTLACLPFDDEDWTQFAQLIGYSVSGAGDLSYFDRDVLCDADTMVEQIINKKAKTHV